MALKFKSNVIHNGILYKAGDIIDGVALEIHGQLVQRGLAEQTEEQATHGADKDASGRALPIEGGTSEQTPEQIAAEKAQQDAAIKAQEAAQAAAAEKQVAEAQRIQDGGKENQTMPSDKQIANEAAQIQ